MTTKYCEECGASENVLLQELYGHWYCRGCLTVALGGGKPAIKEARQMRLDEAITTSDDMIVQLELLLPDQQHGDRAREAIDFEVERKLARERILTELSAFRTAHPWVKPGMVVVNIATGDLAVVRDSTNPDIGWTTVYLTTEYALGMSTRPIIPAATRLRIGDASEYAEARELLQAWPSKAKTGLRIGEPDMDLFNEQFMAALLQEIDPLGQEIIA